MLAFTHRYNMDEREQKDLVETKAKIDQEILDAWSMMEHLSAQTSESIKHYGHQTLGDAFVFTFRERNKKIQQLWREHLRKFPDE